MMVLLLLGMYGTAQIGIGVEIPQNATMTISHSEVVFDLSSVGYPPPSFPAYYYPTRPDPQSEPMSFSVFTNIASWTADVTYWGLLNEQDNVILPADRLEYSTDGGATWYAFSLGGNTIVQSLSGTTEIAKYPFALRLRLVGDEVPGVYTGVLAFSLVTQ